MGIHLVVTAVDDAQAAGVARSTTGGGILVSPVPQIARAQRDRCEARIVGRQHRLLGDGLGRRIRRLEIFAIGHRLGGATFDRMGGAMGHAGRRRVHQLADAVRAAGIELCVPTTLAWW